MPKTTPQVTIVHALPGRLRMKLSHPITEPKQVERSVKGHSGIQTVLYTSITRSLLVVFDPDDVTREEIIIRIGLALALEFGAVPIQFWTDSRPTEMSDSAFYSGFFLTLALLNRTVSWTASGSQFTLPLLDWFGGVSTAWAVLEHGFSEVNERGNFDPEVLSLVYLLIALLRRNFLPAAIFTWITTFGRHLLHLSSSGIEVRPVEVADEEAKQPYHEVVISPIYQPPSDKSLLFRLLPAIIQYMTTVRQGTAAGHLVEEIKKVSALHGEVLEGLGGYRFGIPLKVR